MADVNKKVAGENVPSSHKVADERAVRKTDETVPVKEEDPSLETPHPTDPAAVDRRKHFSGTDQRAADEPR